MHQARRHPAQRKETSSSHPRPKHPARRWLLQSTAAAVRTNKRVLTTSIFYQRESVGLEHAVAPATGSPLPTTSTAVCSARVYLWRHAGASKGEKGGVSHPEQHYRCHNRSRASPVTRASQRAAHPGHTQLAVEPVPLSARPWLHVFLARVFCVCARTIVHSVHRHAFIPRAIPRHDMVGIFGSTFSVHCS